MFLLCNQSDGLPEILYCANSFSSLRRFMNSLDVPCGGLRHDVFDSFGQYYGSFVRSDPFYNATFIKSPRYGKQNETPAVIFIALKTAEMGTRCRNLLNSYYPKYSDDDFVCFNAKNRY